SRQRQQQEQACRAASVALAHAVERRTSLRSRADQLDAGLARDRQELGREQERQADLRGRLDESLAKMLGASASLADGYRLKEAAERSLASLTAERDRKQQEREQLSEEARDRQQTRDARKEEVHALELAVNDLRNEIGTVVGRLRED